MPADAKLNPGVVSATGAMNKLHAVRHCQINNRGKTGNMTERLIEMEPEKKTVWTIEADDMGMAKMLRDTRFCFHLEKMGGQQTRVVAETWYTPANFLARIMNALMMKKIIAKAQTKILANLKQLIAN